MDNLTINNIKSKEYYYADDLIKLNLEFFNGCKNGRRIIDNKKLSKNDYIFAKNINGKWMKSDGLSYKFDKVFIRTDWIKENVPDEEDNDEDNDEDENNEITMAPGLIDLKKSEKMKDNKGNILEIEIRGTREHNNCFFRVSDVAKGFEINDLHRTIIKAHRGYKINIHYRYFLIHNMQKQLRKKLFLTFNGLRKVINTSRNIKLQHNIEILNKWISLFDNRLSNPKYIIHNQFNDFLLNVGYVYCITSNTIDFVKIGFWKGTIDGLRSRYITYYGNDIEIYKVKSMYPNKLEQKCHKKFDEYKITNELFNKKYLNNYISFLKMNKIKIDKKMEEQYKQYKQYNQYVKTNNDMQINSSDQHNESNNIVSIKEQYEKESINDQYEKRLMIEHYEKNLMKIKYDKELMKIRYEKKIIKNKLEIIELKQKLKIEK